MERRRRHWDDHVTRMDAGFPLALLSGRISIICLGFLSSPTRTIYSNHFDCFIFDLPSIWKCCNSSRKNIINYSVHLIRFWSYPANRHVLCIQCIFKTTFTNNLLRIIIHLSPWKMVLLKSLFSGLHSRSC